MSQAIVIELEVPETLRELRLPTGVNERLQELLDRQDTPDGLSPGERREAEGLADLAELLTLLRLRARRLQGKTA
jgi:hypothetical protein